MLYKLIKSYDMNYCFRTKYTARGFSLTELLVVIAIIGILTTVITVNFSLSREKAQNKSLIASLKETQLALEVYKSQFGRYPADESALVPEFIDILPRASDAANDSCVIQYSVDTGGSWYKLQATNCIANDVIGPNNEMAVVPSYCDGTQPGGQEYDASSDEVSIAVYSAGGACY